MKRTQKRIRLCTVLLILNIAFIWGNSLLPGNLSGTFSGWVRDLLAMLFPSGPEDPDAGHGLLRKLAHFTEFACLGGLFAWRLAMAQRPCLWALPCGFLIACADETIQRFVPERGPSFRDVMIDTAGVAAGILLLIIGSILIRKYINLNIYCKKIKKIIWRTKKMKKLIALLLVAVMALSMVACGNKTDDNTETTGATTGNTEATTGANEETTGATDATTGANEETTGATDATTGAEEENKEQAGLTGTADEIVAQIIEKSPVQFMGGQIPLDLTDTSEEGLWALQSFTGLSTAEKLKEAAVFESMTGSQAFSLVVVRVKEAADAKSVAEQMKENINPRKWICVGADQIAVAGYGDVVMFIMVDSQLGLTSQSYVDAFTAICGGKVDFAI